MTQPGIRFMLVYNVMMISFQTTESLFSLCHQICRGKTVQFSTENVRHSSTHSMEIVIQVNKESVRQQKLRQKMFDNYFRCRTFSITNFAIL